MNEKQKQYEQKIGMLKNELSWIVEYFDEHPHLLEDPESAESCWHYNAKQALKNI